MYSYATMSYTCIKVSIHIHACTSILSFSTATTTKNVPKFLRSRKKRNNFNPASFVTGHVFSLLPYPLSPLGVLKQVVCVSDAELKHYHCHLLPHNEGRRLSNLHTRPCIQISPQKQSQEGFPRHVLYSCTCPFNIFVHISFCWIYAPWDKLRHSPDSR